MPWNLDRQKLGLGIAFNGWRIIKHGMLKKLTSYWMRLCHMVQGVVYKKLVCDLIVMVGATNKTLKGLVA